LTCGDIDLQFPAFRRFGPRRRIQPLHFGNHLQPFATEHFMARKDPARHPDLEAALAEPFRHPMTPRRKLAWAGGAAAVVAYPLVFQEPYLQHVVIMIFIYALMAQGWNVLAGYCGQISLGHAVFFGIGAYSSAFLFTEFQISPWLGLVVGVMVSILIAIGIGLPTFRLQGHYFAIATLVIGEIGQTIFLNWEWMGGASGIWIPVTREQPWLNFQFHASKLPNYYISLGFLAAACAIVSWMERSKLGLYFRAIREEPEAARSLGINITGYKLLAISISAAFTSVAGTLFTQYIFVIDPETVFPLLLSILVVLMTMLGGAGRLMGPITGAAVLLPISEISRIYLGGTGGSVDLMVYGVMIVLISILSPGGLVPIVERLAGRGGHA
jgi:branched-chain amino acid transport system permease protein